MDIIKNKNKYKIIPVIIIFLGIISYSFRGLNFGIDFVGGTIIEINLERSIPIDDIRVILDKYDKEAEIIYSQESKEYIIIKSNLEIENLELMSIMQDFKEGFNLSINDYKFEKFKSMLGGEMKKKSIISISLALVGIFIYTSIRFNYIFGIAAIITLIHDILIMASFYSIFHITINNPFILAILTILGYSINDTIVIFDRIRENQILHPELKSEAIINRSINESLRRTINTSITTLIVSTSLYLFGVPETKVIALPLILGIISGTYSSLFIASPVWNWLNKVKNKL